MKTTKKELNSLVSILNSDRPKELKTAKENKKYTGKKKSLNFGIKAKKEVIKPIDQRGKDNLNKFLGQHARRLHVENRTRFYQLRIQLKEKDFSRIITKEINPKIESCNKLVVLFSTKISQLLAKRNLISQNKLEGNYSELRQEIREEIKELKANGKYTLIVENRSQIAQLTDKKNNLLFLYKFRYSIFKELFSLLSIKTKQVENSEKIQDKTNETELNLSSEVLSLIDTYEENLTSSVKLTNFVTPPANLGGVRGGASVTPQKELANPLNTTQENKSGFGIDLIRNYIYSLNPLSFELVKEYMNQFKDLLNSKEIPPFKIIQKRDEIKRFNIIKREYEILEKEKNIDEIRLLDLFKIGIYRESKNNKHALRQVSATNLLKFETYPSMRDILTTKEGKEYISNFESLFSKLIHIEDTKTSEKQNELTIHNAIIVTSKRFSYQINDIEFTKDLIQDAYIHCTLEKPCFSLSDTDLDKLLTGYFKNRIKELHSNTSKFQSLESEDMSILSIPFHQNINTAYQMESALDFDLFINWIETRKYIKPRTKEVITYVLNNLNKSQKDIYTELNISKPYLMRCNEKLTVYAKRYNDIGIYEFLMHKYFNKPYKCANIEIPSEDYKTPSVLKGKSISELKAKEKITVNRTYRPLNTGRNKEMVKSFNYELSKSGKVGITYDIV